MTTSDIAALARNLLAEKSNAGRWDDPTMISFVEEANKAVIQEVEFPASSMQFATASQETTLPEIIKIYRVYVNGQPLVPTTISQLQGDQIEVYDQSQTTTFQPAFVNTLPSTYPVANDGSGAQPGVWTQTRRPGYYLRGASLGILPKPASSVTVQVDFLPFPPVTTALTDVSIFPRHFMACLAWKVCQLAWAGDAQHSGSDQTWTNMALSNFMMEAAKLRLWKEELQGQLPKRVTLMTYRSMWPVQSPTTSRASDDN